jgi:Methyl-CpG binding domain
MQRTSTHTSCVSRLVFCAPELCNMNRRDTSSLREAPTLYTARPLSSLSHSVRTVPAQRPRGCLACAGHGGQNQCSCQPPCQRSTSSPGRMSGEDEGDDGAKRGQAKGSGGSKGRGGSGGRTESSLLQALRDEAARLGTILPEGWTVTVRPRPNSTGSDPYYISPEGKRYRSRQEVRRGKFLRGTATSGSLSLCRVCEGTALRVCRPVRGTRTRWLISAPAFQNSITHSFVGASPLLRDRCFAQWV